MNKTLDTLVSDIYSLAGDGEKPNWDNLSLYTKNCRGSFYRFREERDDSYEPRLRMSNIGKPARQVWYDIKKAPKEGLSGQMRLKFLQGDFLEEQALLLAREAGHFVQDTQKEVEIDGVKGRMDCKIDGVIVDVKSTSSYAFKKFKSGTLEDDDPFGYIDQISGYAQAEGKDEAAFLAVNKETLALAVHKIKVRDVRPRIKILKEAIEKETPPERCYDDKPEGQSGNRVLSMQCSYCPFKQHCWSDANGGKGLRGFYYSYGPKYFTRVVKEPRTMEFKLDALRHSSTTD
jgi:hypothetical protein